MFPTATPTLPESDALGTIAISGRFVASARRIRPPSAEPRCSRAESTSVWSESWTPAAQIAPAQARKTRSRTGVLSDDTRRLLPRRALASGYGCQRADDPARPSQTEAAMRAVQFSEYG